jgi:hypothetical protein|tara:strand:+ start:420 stop:752 length:333 start_codon:yes stop_codon:yes gene_type:complete
MKIDRKYLKDLIQEQINELTTPPAQGEEPEAAPKSLGAQSISKAQHAKAELEKSKGIQKGAVAAQITNKERAILQDVEKLLTAVAEKDDLIKYKGALQQVVNILRKRAGV